MAKPSTPPTGKPLPSGGAAPTPNSQMKAMLPWVIFVALLGVAAILMSKQVDPHKDVPYYMPGEDSFVQFVEDGRIAKCDIIRPVSGSEHVKAEVNPRPGSTGEVYKIRSFVADTKQLEVFLKQHEVGFKVPEQSVMIWQILTSILPVVLVFGLIYFVFMRQMRSAGSGAMSFGKSRAKQLNRDTKKVTFKEVAGIDEEKEEVEEIIEFLRDPKKFQKLGGRIPKGVMLMGPPGTGKTLLARAIAGEADVPFFNISGSDFVEMFVGVGASRVRDMFEQGKRNAPCIIFIDEIDAVGRSRFTGIGGGHDEREQTLNALLVEMDGFESSEGVIIIAATNRPDVLDPALMRPGRFDRQIVIDLPMIEGRAQILKIHSRNIKLADAVELKRVARGTPGFSGADLENLMNEAALLAARGNKDRVEMEDLEEARDKVMWGRERRSRTIDTEERRLTAYHEAGHALVQQVVEETEPLHKVTIIPRGIAYLGATMSLPEKDSYTQTRKKLYGSIVGAMGGRTAELIIFGDVTNGASSDLKVSTGIARRMVCEWGMNKQLGPQSFGDNQELMFLGREVSRSQNYSEETARKIDAEIAAILREASDDAMQILTEQRAKLEMIAERLLELETIDGRDVEEIVLHGHVLPDDERAAIDLAKEEAEAKANPPAEEAKAEASDEEPAEENAAGASEAPTAATEPVEGAAAEATAEETTPDTPKQD